MKAAMKGPRKHDRMSDAPDCARQVVARWYYGTNMLGLLLSTALRLRDSFCFGRGGRGSVHWGKMRK